MRLGIRHGFFLLCSTLLFASSALAIAPRFVPDEELVNAPTIVVAKWEKAKLAPHHLVEGNAYKEMERRTEITVTRVIKGNLKPGKYTILLGPSIGFERDDGGSTFSFTSTQMMGDVADVKDENLWFLALRRSWDKVDKEVHPALDTYRGVQPLELEPYFHAISVAKPDEEVVKLLDSQNPPVIQRALQYLAGGELPWPYVSLLDFERPETTRMPLKAKASSVESLLKRKEPETRRLASSVYAAMMQRKCVPVMRRLLHDDDAQVRANAVGILAQYQDQESLPTFAAALKALEEPELACQIIDILAKWKDERVVPSLMNFLENDRFAYQMGDDIGIPAIKAGHALHDATGLWFPQDVDAANRAWEKVQSIHDRGEREKRWKTLVVAVACPVTAELEGNLGTAHIAVTNATGLTGKIAARPTTIEQSWNNGSSSSEQQIDQFVTLMPGESYRCQVKLEDGFIFSQPDGRRLVIRYWNAGRKQHLKAWIGAVDVGIGHDWEGLPGKIERIVEKWPNGNLKATGEKRDGRKVGHWEFFNEQGDRIREQDIPGSTGICNPEHPDNKGKGRPAAKGRADED